MAARIRTVYSKWRVGADDSVRPDDDRTISDRADRVVGPYKGAIDGITVIEREGQSPSPAKQMSTSRRRTAIHLLPLQRMSGSGAKRKSIRHTQR